MAQDTWSADGFVKAGNEVTSGNLFGESCDQALTAAGSSASTALQLVSQFNVMGTTASSTGVNLPVSPPVGAVVRVVNGGANVLTVYPPSGGTINGGSANAADAATVAAASSGVPGSKAYLHLGSNAYIRVQTT